MAYQEIEWRECKQIKFVPNLINIGDLKVKKINRTTRGIFGTIIYHVSVDDSFLLEAIISIKQGGEYRRMPFKLAKKGCCSALQDDEIIYPDLAAASDFPEQFPCPLPKVT